MYPARQQQYQRFILCNWLNPLFFEFYQKDRLLAVAVTDELSNSLSALYTFFVSKEQDRSLGRYAILRQLEYARAQDKRWLYLGYQVDGCRKMNYKRQFTPHQRLTPHGWQNFDE